MLRDGPGADRAAHEARRGREVENTIPKVLRGQPFVPLSDATSAWEAVRALLDESTLHRFAQFAPNPEGEALVFETRHQLAELFLERGAAHLQIGRTYRCREGLRPPAWRLLEAIKATVDPRGLVNPGVLGLGGDGPQ